MKIFTHAFTLYLLLNASLFQAEAQGVAGYRGKHWIAAYDLAFSPAFIYESRSGEDFTTFNAQNSLTVDYIYQLHKSAIFSLKYYRTNVFFSKPLKIKVTDTGNSYNNYPYNNGGTYEREFNPDTFAGINAFEISTGLKNFSELLAPLGVYTIFDIGLILYKVNARPETFYYKDVNEDYEYPQQITIKQPQVVVNDWYHGVKLGFTWGKQWVVFDKITLNMGVSSGWVLGGLRLGTNEFFDLGSSGYITESDYVKMHSKNRLWGHNLLNFKMGMGFIAY